MSKKQDAIRRELERIASANGGVLWPKKVVEAARDRKSPLHSQFEWDNTVAAERYRVQQARELIRITVNVVGEGTDTERVWVSLRPDREKAGGYRPLIAVMSDDQLRAQLLADAMKDMDSFARKYRHLQELAEVFAAIDRTRRRKKAA